MKDKLIQFLGRGKQAGLSVAGLIAAGLALWGMFTGGEAQEFDVERWGTLLGVIFAVLAPWIGGRTATVRLEAEHGAKIADVEKTAAISSATIAELQRELERARGDGK